MRHCHNHPSRNLKPTAADIQLTKKIKQGRELLDIAVLDHIFLTSEGYYSLADEGLLEPLPSFYRQRFPNSQGAFHIFSTT